MFALLERRNPNYVPQVRAFGCPVPTHPYSLSRPILYSFGLRNVVGKPAIDEERSLFHEVKFADQGGAEVDMGGVAKAQEADALAAQGLADEPALSPGIDLALQSTLSTLASGGYCQSGGRRSKQRGLVCQSWAGVRMAKASWGRR